MPELMPIVDVLKKLKTRQKGDCIYCELGVGHPGYSVCQQRFDVAIPPDVELFAAANPPAVEPIRFGREQEFTLRMATREEDRLRCWRLVFKEYLAHGYVKPQELEYRYSIHDALPDTATFLVEKDGQAVATVSVYPDSPLGLPADEIYHAELDEKRREGRRPVEVGRLTIAKEYLNDRSILAALFDILPIYARCVMGATDLVITVNPSHAAFYERMILFERLGGVKDLGSVCGAPAVLLRLRLELEEQTRRWAHGEGPQPEGVESKRNFYPYVSAKDEEERRVTWLKKSLQAPTEAFLRRYFVWVRPLIPSLPSPLQYLLEKAYPGYDLKAE